jgi:hypothetical protein
VSETPMSKRERQKMRREARLQQERAADKRAQKLRLLVFVLIGVVFAGLVGLAVARNRAESARLAEQEAAVQARLDDLGCTPAEEMEDRGQGHLNANQLASSPPEVLYPDRPATSGEHFQGWLKTGVYDEVMDERVLIHNLEHGYVNVFYDESADAAQIDELKSFAQEQIDGSYPKLIVSAWDGDLPEDYNFAYTGWGVRQMCGEFDTDTLELFLREHHSGAGDAPEKTLPAHMEEGNGTIDPGDEPFLLPPLGDEAVPTEGMDEDGTATDPEATEAPS